MRITKMIKIKKGKVIKHSRKLETNIIQAQTIIITIQQWTEEMIINDASPRNSSYIWFWYKL